MQYTDLQNTLLQLKADQKDLESKVANVIDEIRKMSIIDKWGVVREATPEVDPCYEWLCREQGTDAPLVYDLWVVKNMMRSIADPDYLSEDCMRIYYYLLDGPKTKKELKNLTGLTTSKLKTRLTQLTSFIGYAGKSGRSHLFAPVFGPRYEGDMEGITEPTPIAEDIPESAPIAEVITEPTPIAEDIPESAPIAEVITEPAPIAEDITEPTPLAEVVTEPISIAEPTPIAEVVTEPIPIAEVTTEPLEEEVIELSLDDVVLMDSEDSLVESETAGVNETPIEPELAEVNETTVESEKECLDILDENYTPPYDWQTLGTNQADALLTLLLDYFSETASPAISLGDLKVVGADYFTRLELDEALFALRDNDLIEIESVDNTEVKTFDFTEALWDDDGGCTDSGQKWDYYYSICATEEA